MTNQEKINLIGHKILLLSNNLEKYKAELDLLKRQLELLQGSPIQQPVQQPLIKPQVVEPVIPVTVKEPEKIIETPPVINTEEPIKQVAPQINYTLPPPAPKKAPSSVNMEEYIGGNLISKIGIGVLVIGIAIGVKYVIDEGLISPLTRIVLAYLAGFAILFTAFRLKKRLEGFSAILLSGGMASLYFTTFAAYSFYGLFPQVAAFAVMVVFTAFTVFAATMYDRQEIGIFGLVGAYAVPFMLSDGSGRVEIMFSYMTIINIGILVLSFKKNWNILNHVAYVMSWLIFGLWFTTGYNPSIHKETGLIFSFLFFILFYISLMAYKTIKKEAFVFMDILRILLNSFIYFAIGYAIFSDIHQGAYLGLFTLGNALVHFAFCYSVFVNKQVDKKLFYLLMAMVLCFLTIAVPVQLEGNWVTLFWSTEIFLLFWIGRTKGVQFYEWLAFAMIVPALISLGDDWVNAYSGYDSLMLKYWTAFFNITFLTTLITISSLTGLLYLNNRKPLAEGTKAMEDLYKITNVVIPVIVLLLIYLGINNEISNYWDSKYYLSEVKEMTTYPGYEPYMNAINDSSMYQLKNIWQMIFSLFFASCCCLFSIKKWKHQAVAWTAFGLSIFMLLLFLTGGLSDITRLKEDYLSAYNAKYYVHSSFYVYIRYVSFAFFGLLLYSTIKLCKKTALYKYGFPKVYASSIVHLFILILLSFELTHLVRMNHYGDEGYSYMRATYKMGYTILWSVYSFALVIYGMIRKDKAKRITGMIFFGITLLKLFIFDISDLSTGYKVVAFIVLGILLLVVSFLYQEFKALIFGEENEKKKDDQ